VSDRQFEFVKELVGSGAALSPGKTRRTRRRRRRLLRPYTRAAIEAYAKSDNFPRMSVTLAYLECSKSSFF